MLFRQAESEKDTFRSLFACPLFISEGKVGFLTGIWRFGVILSGQQTALRKSTGAAAQFGGYLLHSALCREMSCIGDNGAGDILIVQACHGIYDVSRASHYVCFALKDMVRDPHAREFPA